MGIIISILYRESETNRENVYYEVIHGCEILMECPKGVGCS